MSLKKLKKKFTTRAHCTVFTLISSQSIAICLVRIDVKARPNRYRLV